MKNKYFTDEELSFDDLFFMCYMIERVSRKIKQHNSYVVNKINKNQIYSLISNAQVLHSLNPLQVEDDWISDYKLESSNFDISNVNPELCNSIPSCTDMGKVYARLIDSVTDDYVEGIMAVYNSELCEVIDNYNSSAYYEPSYVISRAYLNNGF